MPVIGLRMHLAVTGGRERLDREVEVTEKRVAWRVGDRVVAEPVKQSEESVEDREHRCRAADEGRPRRGHAEMAQVGPKIAPQAPGDHGPVAKTDETAVVAWSVLHVLPES